MQQLKWTLTRFADALGLPSLITLALVLGLLLFFPLVRWPAQQRLAEAEVASIKLGAFKKLGMGDSASGAFLDQFPRPEALSQELQTIFDTAEGYGLQLDEVSYRKVRKQDERLERYLVDFAVNAPYPDSRAFLGDVLSTIPSVALDQLSLTRDDVKSSEVHVRVRLTLFLAR